MAGEEIQLDDEQYHDLSTLTAFAQFCSDLYDEYSTSDYRKKKLKAIEEGRKRYDGERSEKTFPWKDCSNVSMGMDAIAVDNLEPRLRSQLIADNEDFIEAEPVGPEDADGAEGVKDFFSWAIANNMMLGSAVKPMIHDLLLDGTLDVIPIWKEKEIVNKVREQKQIFVGPDGNEVQIPPNIPPQMLQMMGIRQDVKDVVVERQATEWKVELQAIALADAFFPDNWDNWGERPYLRFIYPTLGELEDLSEENGGPYKNISKELVLDPERARNDQRDRDAERKGITYSEYSKEIRLLECYARFRGEWRIGTFALDSNWEEVRNQPLNDVYWHGHKPVHRFRLFPHSNESMGTGIPAKITHYSKGIDDLFNQMIDAGTIEIAKFFFYNEVPGFENLDLEISPGKGIPIGKDSNVTIPTFNTNAAQFMTFIQAILSFFERMVSLSDYSLGRESQTAGKGGETFSGMSLIVQEGNIKHQYQGEGLRDVMERLLTDCFTLYAQYMPTDAMRRIKEGEKWVFQPLDVMAIQGSYDIKIQISDASANKMLARKEAMELMQSMGGNPLANLPQLMTDLVKTYGKKIPEKYVVPQAQKVLQALIQFPEIAKLIDQVVMQKTQEANDKQVAQEAQNNVRRQEIERQVEKDSPLEDSKLIDQVKESVKRKALTPVIEEGMGLYDDF